MTQVLEFLIVCYVAIQVSVSVFIYQELVKNGFSRMYSGITVFNIICFLPAIIVGSVLALKVYKGDTK